MLAVERKALIKEIISEKKSVIVADLAQQFGVTEETVRRDLKSLEADGILTRTYGGAFIQDGAINDVDVSIRKVAYLDNKSRIAAKCRELIHNGDSIFLDCSTTALEVAKAVKTMRLTILTNSLLIANHLADCANIHLILIGGTFHPQYMCFLGNTALEVLDTYYVDKAFISCRSLSLEHGASDSNEQSAAVRKRVLSRTDKVYLLADQTKFNRTSFVKICDFQELRAIVTDRPLDEQWKQMACEHGLELIDFSEEEA